jgi:hypothetical protein
MTSQSTGTPPADSGEDTLTENLFEPHPTLGAYLSHHPVRREILLLRAAFLYGVPVMVLQLLFMNDDSTLISLLLISGYAVWALMVGWYVLHLWNREVVLYERGFTYREGSRDASFPYENIVELYIRAERLSYFGIWQRDKYDLTLITGMDETMHITNLYSDVEQLVDRLERFIARDRLPHVREQLRQGERVSFGEHLQLSETALFIDNDNGDNDNGDNGKGASLPREQFGGYRVQGGQLRFLQQTGSSQQQAQKQEWARLAVVDISQPVLLLSLLRQWTAPDTPATPAASRSSRPADT